MSDDTGEEPGSLRDDIATELVELQMAHHRGPFDYRIAHHVTMLRTALERDEQRHAASIGKLSETLRLAPWAAPVAGVYGFDGTLAAGESHTERNVPLPGLAGYVLAALQSDSDKLRERLSKIIAEMESWRPVVNAAFAYADSTADTTDTPHEDALLDAVNAYRTGATDA